MVACFLWLRDVVQAYIQSKAYLSRNIFVRPPPELAILLPPGTLLKVVKPLYGTPNQAITGSTRTTATIQRNYK